MLAQMGRYGILTEDSEIENLGLIVVPFISYAGVAEPCRKLLGSSVSQER